MRLGTFVVAAWLAIVSSDASAATVCTTNTQCDDNDVCTIDVCTKPAGSPTGTCTITTIPSCCSTAAQCNDADACTTDTCNPATHTCGHADLPNCCTTDTDCDDNQTCTADHCNVATHACTHAAIAGCCTDTSDCDDGVSCTFDRCDMATHSCRNVRFPNCCTDDAQCADTNVCSIDHCDLTTNQCQHDPVAGCCNTNPQCNDGNTCTVDTCNTMTHTCIENPIPGCCTTAADCNDNDACTTDSCSTGPGPHTCSHQDVPSCCTTNSDCTDADLCTADVCNTTTHTCGHNPIAGCCTSNGQCDDNDTCTTDTCDATSHSCMYMPVGGPMCGGGNDCQTDNDCGDNRICTLDRCDPMTHECHHDDISTCCTRDFECFDADLCTFDRCDDDTHTCTHQGFPNCCTSDARCDDQNPCTADTCDSTGTCSNTQIAGCCLGRGDCDDNNSCTSDRCSMQTHTCTHTAPPGCCVDAAGCDDQNDCTTDTCDDGTCGHAPIANCTPRDGVANGDAMSGDAGPHGVDLGGGGCGCQSSGGPGGALALVLVVGAVLGRRRRGLVIMALVLAPIAVASTARADGFDADLYQATTSSSGYLTQESADVLPVDQFDAGASFDFARDPLVARDAVTGETVANGRVIANRVGMQLVAGFGLARWVEVGLAVPVILAQNGDASPIMTSGRALATTTLGDIRLFGKARVWSRGNLALAGALDLTIPTGNTDSFAGGSAPTVRPRAILGWQGPRVGFAADLGYRVQGRNEVANIIVDDEITVGIGGAVALRPAKLWLLGEAFLAAGVMGQGHDVPAELLLGLRAAVLDGWQGQVALGEGVGHGYGTPNFQAVASLRYSADFAKLDTREPVKPPVHVAPPPDPDPDHDGILGSADQCPNDPEDKDGFQDEDGCPDLDNDLDGIPDAIDKCPNEPEDMDKFEDEDGCPELDNDGDGIADNRDACPNDPETKNGYQDDDGCPDEIPDKVKHFAGEVQKIAFKLGSADLLPVSKKVLDKAVLLLVEFPDLTLQIVGHTDDQPLGKTAKFADNEALSQARADSVKAYLVSKNVDESRLISRGLGATQPVVDPEGLTGSKLAAARTKNRRVEFIVGKP